MKNLQKLEERLHDIQNEMNEVERIYPFYKVNGLYRCQREGVSLRNEINRKLFNVKTNINQTKMRMMKL